ncbi:MAG: tRNA lysidine(34) synthetase TilS [Pirellulales bacterium]
MHSIEQTIADCWTPDHWADLSVLVAVSGGADSVALARALAAIRRPGAGRVILAHFNHGWRGAESDADEQFVRELAAFLGWPIEVGRADGDWLPGDPATSAQRSEAAARRQRYRFLRQTAERLGARYIALGHTADDQIETILHRILRGTGLAGLAGIPQVRALGEATSLVRPLLDVRRESILEYLAVIGQPYRSDSSNESRAFTRNRLRHELLPQLARQYNPRVGEALLRLGQQAADVGPTIDRIVAELMRRCQLHPARVSVPCQVLRGTPPLFVRELLKRCWRTQQWPERDMTFEHWDQLARLAEDWSTAGRKLASGAPSWRITLPGGIRATRLNDEIVLEPTSAQ